MSRTLEARPAALRPQPVDPTLPLPAWLAARASNQVRWLLVHGEDGVTWGRLDGASLLTGDQVDPTVPPLTWETLLTARLFGPGAELLVWRHDDGWRGRWIEDQVADPTWTEALDEAQILWGDTAQARDAGFTRLTDGAQGLAHTVPLPVRERGQQVRPVRLTVRHYVAPDEQHAGRIVASRLVDLTEVQDG
ncbi:MAG: TIGR03984 family CRISPR-associated protein [Fimbriimonadaceae bacterium]|nr:TIGR03984 family CRISPR-associated protein [Fimbriimonadaceae bacterium]